jgi:single-strand DNA-binding protein
LVEGRLVPDQATGGPKTYTKKDGTPGASYDVSALTVRFLSSRTEGEGPGAPVEETGAAPSEDEIPF